MDEEVREDKFLDLFKGEKIWPFFFFLEELTELGKLMKTMKRREN